MAPSSALAFDAVASTYDATFGASPVGRLFRFRLAERVTASVPEPSRVLDLGCGTGEDALWLGRLGHTVCGIDPSPAMVEVARAKAARVGSTATFECRSLESLGNVTERFDVVLSDFGALNCASLRSWASIVPSLLRPMGRAFLVLLGPCPLPELLRGGPEAVARRRKTSVKAGAHSLPVEYPSNREVGQVLAATCTTLRVEAMGCLVPGPGYDRFARRNPMMLGLLAMMESLVRGAPGLRGLGDHTLFEFQRR